MGVRGENRRGKQGQLSTKIKLSALWIVWMEKVSAVVNLAISSHWDGPCPLKLGAKQKQKQNKTLYFFHELIFITYLVIIYLLKSEE